MLWKDSFETPLRQVLMYLWKAACDRFNKRKEKEKRIKREVRRMGRNTKRFFAQPSFFTTLIIIMMTFNQGTKPTPDAHPNYNQDKSFSKGSGTPHTGWSTPTSHLISTPTSQSKQSQPSGTLLSA
jgi:hypothetical protein